MTTQRAAPVKKATKRTTAPRRVPERLSHDGLLIQCRLWKRGELWFYTILVNGQVTDLAGWRYVSKRAALAAARELVKKEGVPMYEDVVL